MSFFKGTSILMKIQSVVAIVIPTSPSIFNRFLVALAIVSRLTWWMKKERVTARLPSRLQHRVQCLREARCEGSPAKRVSEPGSPFRIHTARRSCERYSYCEYALCEGHSLHVAWRYPRLTKGERFILRWLSWRHKFDITQLFRELLRDWLTWK